MTIPSLYLIIVLAADVVNQRALTQQIWKRQYIYNLFSHNSSVIVETGYDAFVQSCFL